MIPRQLAAGLACYIKTIDCLKVPRDNRPFPGDSQGESVRGSGSAGVPAMSRLWPTNFAGGGGGQEWGKSDPGDLAIGSGDHHYQGAFTRTLRSVWINKIEAWETEPVARVLHSVFNGGAAMISARSWIYLDPESGRE